MLRSNRRSIHSLRKLFEEGIVYSRATVSCFLATAHAMAEAGDRRAIDHPYLRCFPTWAVMHLQPARMLVNCFDAGGGIADRSDKPWRTFLAQMVNLLS